MSTRHRSRLGVKSRTVHDHYGQRSKRGRAHATETSSGGSGGRTTPPTAPPESVVKELEAKVADLQRQLRDERVLNVIDLRVSLGLINENARGTTFEQMQNPRAWPDDILKLVREDLLKIIHRLTARDSTPTTRPLSGGRDQYRGGLVV